MAEITKLTLKTKDGVEIELSPKEAKELQAALNEIFGQTRWYPYSPVWPVVYGEPVSIPSVWTTTTCGPEATLTYAASN